MAEKLMHRQRLAITASLSIACQDTFLTTLLDNNRTCLYSLADLYIPSRSV